MKLLTTTILDIRRLLREGAFTNEHHISKQVVMRPLESLGWDVFDPKHVRSEFGIENRRVDYALFREPFGATWFLPSGRVRSCGVCGFRSRGGLGGKHDQRRAIVPAARRR